MIKIISTHEAFVALGERWDEMALLSHYGGGDYYDYQVENAGGFTCRILIAGEQIRFVTQERGFR